MLDRLWVVSARIKQQCGQPPSAALPLARLVRLGAQIPLHDVICQPLGVHEDGLGERDHARGGHPRLGGEVGGAPPGRPNSSPERLPQRLEAPAGLELRLAQAAPDLSGFGARPLATLDSV